MAGILSDIGDALGLTNKMTGFEKVRIESWDMVNRTGDSPQIFHAFINPDEFTLNYNVNIEDTKTPGAHSKLGKLLGIAPLEVTLKFFLDGTGANGIPCDVPGQIDEFYKTVGYDAAGKKHNIRYLRIIWGKLSLLRPNQYALECLLKNASIQYKLFASNGLPLRVLITGTFVEALSDESSVFEFPTSSPDLTHVRVAKEGDTLPGMVKDIYGDLKYYLEIARVNKLKDFRNISPGQKIIFPPFEKNSKK